MLPIGQQAGLPRTWEVAGRTFTVSGLTYLQIATLSDRLEHVLPHPIDAAKARIERLGDLLDKEDRRRFVLDAYEASLPGSPIWPPSFESPDGQRYYYADPDGVAFLLYVILRKHHPDLTLDQVARDVAPHVSIADMERLNVAIEIISEEELARRKARLAGVDPDAAAPNPYLNTESDDVEDEDQGDPKP